MTSAWLSTDLDIYEKHVELDSVGQAAAIRDAIEQAVASYSPSSFLYLGCAGGNGLEAVGDIRVLALDINKSYIDKARERFSNLTQAEFLPCDLNQELPGKASFDLAFGALVFEYIEDLKGLLEQLSKRVNGRLIALILATRQGAPAVSDSPYKEALQPVGREFRFLSVEAFTETATKFGFVLERKVELPLPGGKHFVSITLQRRL